MLKNIYFLAFFGLAFGRNLNVSLDDNPALTCYTQPCVDVEGVGKIMGTEKDSEVTGKPIYSYYAIPYGKAPEGDLRFAPPQAADPLNDGGYRHDGTYSTYLLSWINKICPQAGVSLQESYVKMMTEKVNTKSLSPEENEIMEMNRKELQTKATAGKEDCLHLAVFTPKSPQEIENGNSPLLPVMFFIHGGAFYMGVYFGMGPRALLENDVVLVEIQYRLGPLGFMCLDHPEAAGNMGMMDQSLALQWVQDHIRDFGGDPNQVTIFGESAGAASVAYHMLSPMSQNNFHRVIGQSGSALAGWAFDQESEKHAKDIAGRVGCPTEDLDQLVRCMKEVDYSQIVDTHTEYIKNERYNGRMGFGGTSPCAQKKGDVIFIEEHPEELLVSGRFTPKPVVFGTNKHEGSFVLGVMYNRYIEPRGLVHNSSFLQHEFLPTMLDALGLHDSSGVIYEVIEHDYFNISDLGDWDKMMPGMINIVGTFFIKAATYEFMKYNTIHGGQSHFYSLEYEGENSIWNLLFMTEKPPLPHGVTHADDLIYVFSTGLFERTGHDLDISQDISSLWTNFASSGKFVTRRGMEIPNWTEQNPRYLKIDVEEKIHNDFIYTWNNPDRLDNCGINRN